MTRTMVTRVTLTPDMPTQATLGQVTGVRFTVRRLYAHTATIHTTRMRALRAATTVLSGSPAAYLLEQDRGSEVATMAGVSTGLGAITVVAASTDVRDSDRLLAPLQDMGQQAASAVETASVDSMAHNTEAIFRAEVMDSEAVTLSTVAAASTEAEAEARTVEVATAVDAGNSRSLN